MAAKQFDVGPVTSYAIAVEHGYTGTEAEWIALIQAVTSNAEAAVAAAEAAQNARTEVMSTQLTRLQEINTAAQTALGEAQALHASQILQLQSIAAEAEAAAASAQAGAEAAADAISDAQTAAEAAQTQVENMIATIPSDYSDLSAKVLLEMENIPGTTQTPVFVDGVLTRIEHKNGSNVNVRVDAITITAASITEVRTLSSGQTLTMVSNLSTMETTVTYTNV